MVRTDLCFVFCSGQPFWAAILGSIDFHFVVRSGAFLWMDLYSVNPFSLQNHLEATSPEMSKGMFVQFSPLGPCVKDTGINGLGYSPGSSRNFSSKAAHNWLPALQSLNVEALGISTVLVFSSFSSQTINFDSVLVQYKRVCQNATGSQGIFHIGECLATAFFES